jgi:hypothetical protein
MIMDIAIPTGFMAVQSSLDEVVQSGIATRVEVAGRKVIFYIDDLARGEELEVEFDIIALFPVKAKGGTSQAYSYYKPEVRSEARGTNFEVQGEIPSKFGADSSTGPGPEGDIGTDSASSPVFPLVVAIILVFALAAAAADNLRRR